MHPAISLSLDKGNLISGGFDSQSRDARIDVARDALKHVRVLADFLPTHKITEVKWIEKERAEIAKLNNSKAENSRLVKLFGGPEFQHQKLDGLLKTILDALECAANPNVELKGEMLCWSVASFNMTDSVTLTDSIRILRNSGILPANIVQQAELSDVNGLGDEYTWLGRGMQEYILIPYLAGKIKK